MGRAALVSFGVACLLALVLLFIGLPTPFPRRPSADAGTLRVAVANLSFENPETGELTEVVARLEADVLIALEWTGDNLRLAEIVGPTRRVLLDEPRDGPHGVLTLVRRDLDVIGSVVPSPVAGVCGMPVATIRIRKGGRWISVLGVHVPPTLEACGDDNEKTLNFLGNLVADGALRDGLGVAQTGDLLILTGDFNATPESPQVARILASLDDAQPVGSWLPTGTWEPRDVPLSYERIDYLLASPGIVIEDAWTVALPGSDHRAVVADTRIPDGRRR